MDNQKLVKIVDALETCVQALNDIKSIINNDFYDNNEKILNIKVSLYLYNSTIKDIKNDME